MLFLLELLTSSTLTDSNSTSSTLLFKAGKMGTQGCCKVLRAGKKKWGAGEGEGIVLREMPKKLPTGMPPSP